MSITVAVSGSISVETSYTGKVLMTLDLDNELQYDEVATACITELESNGVTNFLSEMADDYSDEYISVIRKNTDILYTVLDTMSTEAIKEVLQHLYDVHPKEFQLTYGHNL